MLSVCYDVQPLRFAHGWLPLYNPYGIFFYLEGEWAESPTLYSLRQSDRRCMVLALASVPTGRAVALAAAATRQWVCHPSLARRVILPCVCLYLRRRSLRSLCRRLYNVGLSAQYFSLSKTTGGRTVMCGRLSIRECGDYSSVLVVQFSQLQPLVSWPICSSDWSPVPPTTMSSEPTVKLVVKTVFSTCIAVTSTAGMIYFFISVSFCLVVIT